MTPECTATCDARDQVDAAVEVLAISDVCPFVIGQPMYDGLHLDVADPACPARCEEFGKAWATACRTCVRTELESRGRRIKEDRS